MALQTKLIGDIDTTGRVITLTDTTGLYSSINTEGYNTPNPDITDIESITFTLSRLDTNIIDKVVFTKSEDPEYTGVFDNPSVEQIASGSPVTITSLHIDVTKPEEGIKAFSDGIIDINMYTTFSEILGVTGLEDSNFIIGSGFLSLYQSNVTSILINNEFYTINKTIDSNNGTVLYLLENLKEDITSFYPVYRSNYKLYNGTQSDCCIREASGKATYSNCKCTNDKEDTLVRLTMYKIWAQLDYQAKDYINSNKKLISAVKACKSFNCKCK